MALPTVLNDAKHAKQHTQRLQQIWTHRTPLQRLYFDPSADPAPDLIQRAEETHWLSPSLRSGSERRERSNGPDWPRQTPSRRKKNIYIFYTSKTCELRMVAICRHAIISVCQLPGDPACVMQQRCAGQPHFFSTNAPPSMAQHPDHWRDDRGCEAVSTCLASSPTVWATGAAAFLRCVVSLTCPRPESVFFSVCQVPTEQSRVSGVPRVSGCHADALHWSMRCFAVSGCVPQRGLQYGPLPPA